MLTRTVVRSVPRLKAQSKLESPVSRLRVGDPRAPIASRLPRTPGYSSKFVGGLSRQRRLSVAVQYGEALKASAQPRGGSPAPRQAATRSKLTLRSVGGGAGSHRKFLGALPSWVRPTFSVSCYTLSLGRLAARLSTPFRAASLSSPTEVWPPPEPRWAPGGLHRAAAKPHVISLPKRQRVPNLRS